MQIIVFRHGIAMDRADPACPPEAQRPLTEAGLDLTRQAARGLASLDLRPDRIISSPWTRAMQTAEIALEELGLPGSRLELNGDLLPFSNPAAIVEELSGQPLNTVLLVGHAPHLDSVLDLCLGAGAGSVPWLKKAGAALVRNGQLVWFRQPRDLRALADRRGENTHG